MPVLMMATFKIDADIKQNQNPQWQAINDIKGGKVLVISPPWEDLNYCYYTDKEKYFLGSRKAFETTRKADNIIVDYEFIANITQYKSKNVLVSIKSLDSNIELKKVLDDHFVFLNEHSSNLLEFAPKP